MDKNIKRKKMYAYFAADGFCQVRTISDTKKKCKYLLFHYDGENSEILANIAGWKIKRFYLSIELF